MFEKLKIIEFIEIENFEHKIRLTKKYKDCLMEVIGNYLYVERWIYE